MMEIELTDNDIDRLVSRFTDKAHNNMRMKAFYEHADVGAQESAKKMMSQISDREVSHYMHEALDRKMNSIIHTVALELMDKVGEEAIKGMVRQELRELLMKYGEDEGE